MIRPVTRLQAALLLAGPPLLALALHLSYCRWAHHDPALPEDRVLVLEHPPPAAPAVAPGGGGPGPGPPFGARSTFSGVFARHSAATATGLGLVVPIAILGLQAWVISGWRHQRRVDRGDCPNCGHALGPGGAGRCSECGIDRPSLPTAV